MLFFFLQTILINVRFVVLPITLLHVNQNNMTTYFLLCREYNLCLPRREVEEVDNLRDEWIKLMELAERVSQCSKLKMNLNIYTLLINKYI